MGPAPAADDAVLSERHQWAGNIQTNANPTSYPQLSDDGKVLAYINDGNSSSIYDSRAHFSTLNGGVYTSSSEIDAPTEFSGYGDTSVSLSGTGSFAAAAWVRMGTDLPGKMPVIP